MTLRRLAFVIPLICLLAGRLYATAIVVPLLDKPIDLLTSPTVQIVSHGAQTVFNYRVTIEVENQFTTDTLSIKVPRESLRVYTDPETGEYVTNAEPTDEGTIWVRYDTTASKTYHVRRMKPAYTRPRGEGTANVDAFLRYTDEVVVPGDTVMGIDLDFELPPGEAPHSVTFIMDHTPLGYGLEVDSVQTLQLVGRGVLRYLRNAYAPWMEEQEKGTGERGTGNGVAPAAQETGTGSGGKP